MDSLCRSRFISLQQPLFNLLSCSMCYQYLFPRNQNFISSGLFLIATGKSKYIRGTRIPADVNNATFVNKVCITLKEEGDCEKWTSCCRAAIKCCVEQLTTPLLYNGSYCPRIWDGYGCFQDTLPGVRESIQCPSYVEHGKNGKLHQP